MCQFCFTVQNSVIQDFCLVFFFFRSKAIISYFSRINYPSQIIGPLKIQRGLNAAGDYSKGSVCLRGTKIVNL